jgi:hypothetical protein
MSKDKLNIWFYSSNVLGKSQAQNGGRATQIGAIREQNSSHKMGLMTD